MEAYTRELQWVRAAVCLQEVTQDQLPEITNSEHKMMTHSIVVEPVLGKDHVPKVLSDLVSGL